MKENGGQAINQEKCDDTKAEAEQAKLEAKLAKEEVLRCKIEQEKEEVMQSKIEGVKEELLKCKINMAKAETEWYKKAAEECKNEKRIGTDKPSIRERMKMIEANMLPMKEGMKVEKLHLEKSHQIVDCQKFMGLMLICINRIIR